MPDRAYELKAFLARQAYARQLTKETVRLMGSAYDDLAARARQAGALGKTAQSEYLRSLANSVASTLAPAYRAAQDHHLTQSARLSQIEQDAAAYGLATRGVSVVSTGQALSIAQLPVSGLKLGEWWENAHRNMSSSVKQSIQLGLIQGKSSDEIARSIASADAEDPSAKRAAFRAAERLVRTTTSAVQSAAATATYRRLGPGVSDRYVFRATMDDRTSIICASLDGEVFRHDDDDAPRPPLHPNCRSDIVPLLVGEEPEEDDRSLRSYEKWFNEQDEETQDDIMGRGRAELLRNGDVDLSDLISEDRRVLTLDELRSTLVPREPEDVIDDLESDRLPAEQLSFDRGVLSAESEETVPKFMEATGLPPTMTREEFLREHFAGLKGMPFEMQLSQAEFDENVGYFKARVLDAATRLSVGTIERSISIYPDGIIVNHDYFLVKKEIQNTGFAARYLDKAVEQYKTMGVKEVRTHANIDVGGYAWARYGFVPTEGSWRSLLRQLTRQTDGDPLVHGFLKTLSPKEPKDIWKIADSAYGKELLKNTDWNGTLHLTDRDSMARWSAYINDRKAKAGA